MNQTKRIVTIEGDAFDADAIVAIVKYKTQGKFAVVVRGDGESTAFDYGLADANARDAAMAVAVDAWRAAVGDVMSIPTADPLPDLGPDHDPEDHIVTFWTDTKGRFYETYGGSTVHTGELTGRFIWNEGPPRRKNPLGPGASPILKTYVDEAGKPLDPQPV